VRLRRDRPHVFAKVVGSGQRLKSVLEIALGSDIRSNEPTNCRGFLRMRDRGEQDDAKDDGETGQHPMNICEPGTTRRAALRSDRPSPRVGPAATPRPGGQRRQEDSRAKRRGVRRLYLKQQRADEAAERERGTRPATPTAASTSD
jgi:hypothetical protein